MIFYGVSDTVLGTRDTAIKKRDMVYYILVGKEAKKKE